MNILAQNVSLLPTTEYSLIIGILSQSWLYTVHEPTIHVKKSLLQTIFRFLCVHAAHIQIAANNVIRYSRTIVNLIRRRTLF